MDPNAAPADLPQITVADALRRAVELHREDDLEAAEALYLGVLQAVPEQPDALHFLGVLRHGQGRSEEALALIRRALDQAPDYVDAWNNLGNVLKQTERVEEAEEAYLEVIARAPEHLGAWNNLGVVLAARGEHRRAVEVHRKVLELAPDLVDAYYNLANALRRSGDPDEAVNACRRVLQLNPQHARAHNLLGYSLYMMGRRDDAAAVFRDWLEQEPDNPVAAHMLAASGGEGVPERASDAYVRDTFDRFADSFDEQLLQKLDYHAPELLVEGLTRVLPPADASLEVLDAGCGTGLCAPLLRPFAARLTGVDLSAGMLRKAAERGGYDRLVEGELTAFLDAHDMAYDVVASADTLVYFGALEEAARAARRALRPGGWLGFTVERYDGEEPYRINPHGRYSHTDAYLRGVLSSAGFDPIDLSAVVLRTELMRPVHGWLVLARVPDGADPAAHAS
jgi:predicted TPR repeat methyltransferase